MLLLLLLVQLNFQLVNCSEELINGMGEKDMISH